MIEDAEKEQINTFGTPYKNARLLSFLVIT